MTILENPITLQELKSMAESGLGDLVKAVVDIKHKTLAIDAELHADLESLFLASGSTQEHLWGINLYPDLSGDDFIEFDSMINLRPSLGNSSRGVNDQTIRRTIIEIVHTWVKV